MRTFWLLPGFIFHGFVSSPLSNDPRLQCGRCEEPGIPSQSGKQEVVECRPPSDLSPSTRGGREDGANRPMLSAPGAEHDKRDLARREEAAGIW